VHVAVAKIAQLPGNKLADARVADALAASVRQVEALLLARDEDGRGAVACGLAVALAEVDRSALALLDVLPELRLEAPHAQALGIASLLPVLLHRVEHVARAREEGLALAPVGHELVEVARLEP